MIYLENLDNLTNLKRDIIEPLIRGASLDEVPFQDGYRDFYEKWTKVVGEETLIKMNPDDRLLSFTDFIREENKRFAEKFVKKEVPLGKRKDFNQAIARGMYLRASLSGSDFDTIIPYYELDKVDSLDMRVLSDTYVSTSTNWMPAIYEQSALIFAQKLREQHFLVQNITAGPVFKAEVIHPKAGSINVTVDLMTSLTEVLMFEFEKSDGTKKEVALNVFGDAYGIIEDEFAFIDDSQSSQVDVLELSQSLNEDKNLKTAKIGALGLFGASTVKNVEEEYLDSTDADDFEEEQFAMKNVKIQQNVQVAKANVKAKIEFQENIRSNDEEVRAEAYEKYKESLKESAKYNDERRQEIQKRMKADSKKQGTLLKLATGATVGAGSAGALLSWFIL